MHSRFYLSYFVTGENIIRIFDVGPINFIYPFHDKIMSFCPTEKHCLA